MPRSKHPGCALLRARTVRAWGNTDYGQAGTGADPDFHGRPLTLKIAGVASICAAGNNSFAVKTDGSLCARGGGGPGECPLTTNVRAPAPALPGLT